MLTFKGGFEGSGFLPEIKSIQEADGASLEVGWFDEKHPTAPMTFAELASYHAHGGGGRVIPRDVLVKVEAVYPFERDQEAMRALSDWLDNPTDIRILLEKLGESRVNRIKSIFGTHHLTQTESNPDPLVDTGALRDNTKYKIENR